MSNITVTLISEPIEVTQSTQGFAVTTPEGVAINVATQVNEITVSQPQQVIAVSSTGPLSTDQLVEGAVNLYYTNARADARVALGIAGINYPVDSVNGQTNVVVLDTDDINEGTTNLYYTTARANNDFDTRLATKSTTNLAEGTNLYYTTGRSNSDFDTRLATKSTTNLTEGTNLYYTTVRSNTDFDTRLATKTTTNLAEGSNLYYTTTRGNTDFDARLATKTTDNLNEGTTNKYFTNTLARQAVQVVDTGGVGSLSYNNTTGDITYTGATDTEVRTLFSAGAGISYSNITGVIASTITQYTDALARATNSAGTGVAYDSGTGVISIGQPVATTDAVQFNSVQLDAIALLDTVTLTTTTTAALQIVDSFSAATYQSAKYQVQIASGGDYQAMEILVVHNGTTATQTVYADVKTNTDLATFAVDINLGLVRLLTTPTNASTTYRVVRCAITA